MENDDSNFLRINILQIIDDNRPSGCGYCKDKITNIRKQTSYKLRLILKSIPIDILEEMFTKGWARCGDIVYKTIYEKTCCKLYQPRININNFKIANEQKKIMKRFRKFLSGEYELNKLKITEKNKNEKNKNDDIFQIKIYQKVKNYIDSKIFLNILKKYVNVENDLEFILNKINDTKIRKNTNKKYNFNYSCDFIFIIIKMMKAKKNKEEKNQLNQIKINEDNNVNEYKNLVEELYNNFIEYYKPLEENVSFNEITGHINFLIKNQDEYNKILNNISNNNINNINIPYKNKNIISENKSKSKNKEEKEKYICDYFPEIVNEPEIYLPLKHLYTLELTDKIQLLPTEERFLLYNKYQRAVHNENSSINIYNNNWGLSILEKNKKISLPQNLSEKTKHPELYPQYYGTYNLIHRIDGKIIAVTVIDILPNSLESIYCYYDPDYSFLDLGVFTVIREIEYLKSFQNIIGKDVMYYSMGEMCQSCQKLKYKGNYQPTEIMDHFTGKYVFLTDEVKNLIADNKCHHLVKNDENPIIKYYSDIEIENIFWNLVIEVFGEKVFIDDFFELYLQNENYKITLSNCIRRFLQIIDKDIFQKIQFYFDGSMLNGLNI